jgi:hypothetical protein
MDIDPHDLEAVWRDDDMPVATGMMMQARSAKAERLADLAAAKGHPHGTVILRSTMSDHPYVVCDGSKVGCDEAVLWQLLSDLDHVIWSDSGEALPVLAAGDRLADGAASGGAKVVFAALTITAGGDSGATTGGLWVHPDFHARALAVTIADVLEGRLARLGLTEVPDAPEGEAISW